MGYPPSASTTHTSVSQLLPTVREDSELSIESMSPQKSNPNNAGARPKTLMSRSVPSLKMSPTSGTESHPGMCLYTAMRLSIDYVTNLGGRGDLPNDDVTP